jgi:hypothetical protein
MDLLKVLRLQHMRKGPAIRWLIQDVGPDGTGARMEPKGDRGGRSEAPVKHLRRRGLAVDQQRSTRAALQPPLMKDRIRAVAISGGRPSGIVLAASVRCGGHDA